MIEQYDHPLRFHVLSDTRKGRKHLVDLSETELGECSCEAFEFKHREAGTRCKHIVAARDHVATVAINSIRKLENGPQPQN